MRKLQLVVASTMLVLAAYPTPARAQSFFSDLALFLAATSNHTTEGFEGIAPAGNFTTIGSIGSTLLSSGTASELYVVDSGWNPGYNWGTGAVFAPSWGVPNNSVTMSFAGPITAFGILFGGWTGPGVIFEFLLSDGSGTTQLTSGAQPNWNFFGVTSLSGFTSLTISSGENPLLLDNMILADATSVVPEPVSMLLLGSGLAGIGAARRRRRRNV